MSGLPGVTIGISDGNLGRSPANKDGLGAFILGPSVVAPASGALLTPYLVRSLAEAEAIGVTAAYDVANDVLAHHHLKEFFAEAGTGTPVYFLISNQVNTAYWGASQEADKLMNASGGELRWIAAGYTPPTGAPAATNGLPTAIITSITNAKVWQAAQFAQHKPCAIIMEGYAIASISGLTYDLKGTGGPNAKEFMVVIGQTAGTWNSAMSAFTNRFASIGAAAGRVARTPVHRNIGRVKDGPVAGTSSCGFSNAASITTATDTQLNTLHDLGYTFMRVIPGLSGVYWNKGNVTTQATSDYQDFSDIRTMHKAVRITYVTYVNELNDEVEINETDGTIAVSVVKNLQGMIESAIDTQMAGSISGVGAFIDPAQNIQQDNELDVEVSIVKMGTIEKLKVSLAYALQLNN